MSDEHHFERPLVTRKDTDWEWCCLCQNKSKIYLRCPYKKECYHEAYQALEDDMNNFFEHDVPLSLGMNLQCLNDGSGIPNTLIIIISYKLAIVMDVKDDSALILCSEQYQREQRKDRIVKRVPLVQKLTLSLLTLYQKERATPFPLYVGLKLHAHDRQKRTISIFHALGTSV